MNDLEKWIKQMGGYAKTGRLLGLSKVTVWQWCNSTICPRPEQMAKIRKASNYSVSFDKIIDQKYGNK